MAVKPNGKTCYIKEQIIEDLVSGLTLKFTKYPGNKGSKLTIYGNLPYGNRDFVFEEEGEHSGGGTFRGALCRPNWLKEVKG